MIYILAGRDGRPSMKCVYSQMKEAGELLVRRKLPRKEYVRRYVNHNVDKYIKSPMDLLNLDGKVVIRWGSRIGEFKEGIVYNKNEAIKKATNKKLSRQILIDNKISCPRLVDETWNTFPVIARPAQHAKGRNFVVLKNKADFLNHYKNYSPKGWYYSEFIDKEQEFRVHCAHGKVLAVMKKVAGGDKIAWNRAVVGEPFTWVLQQDYNYAVCIEALKATKALGLDFSGVDVMLKGDKAYVVENNTSQTLNSSERVSAQYAKYFDWLSRKDKRRKHWDFTLFKKAKSLAWKLPQLMDEVEINDVEEEAPQIQNVVVPAPVIAQPIVNAQAAPIFHQNAVPINNPGKITVKKKAPAVKKDKVNSFYD